MLYDLSFKKTGCFYIQMKVSKYQQSPSAPHRSCSCYHERCTHQWTLWQHSFHIMHWKKVQTFQINLQG